VPIGQALIPQIVYHGPRAMEELAQYDPNLVVGILGQRGNDLRFKLIHDAQNTERA